MKTKGAIFAFAAILTMTGCAIGNKADYRQAVPSISVSTDHEVIVSVVDERPYVTRGSKRPNYVGTVRGGYYNPFNATTVSGRPLASDLQDAVITGFERAGVKARQQLPGEPAATDDQRILVLTLKEWKSDTYMRTRFDHDVAAIVRNARGEVLGTSSSQGSGAVDNIIEAGRGILRSTVGDAEVLAAISGEAVAVPMARQEPASSQASGAAYDECMARVMRISDSELRLNSMAACDAAQPD